MERPWMKKLMLNPQESNQGNGNNQNETNDFLGNGIDVQPYPKLPLGPSKDLGPIMRLKIQNNDRLKNEKQLKNFKLRGM